MNNEEKYEEMYTRLKDVFETLPDTVKQFEKHFMDIKDVDNKTDLILKSENLYLAIAKSDAITDGEKTILNSILGLITLTETARLLSKSTDKPVYH